MSTTTMSLQPNDSIENFLSLLKSISEHLLAAAQMLSRLAHHDPVIIDKIREQAPAVSPGFLSNLLRVGEGSLHPKLLMNSNAAYSRLRALPYTVQEQVLAVGAVDLAVNADSSASIRVPLTELAPDQIARVFCTSGVRSVDEQRALMKRRELTEAKPTTRAEAFPWLVKKDKVTILRAVELTRKDLLRILEEMAS